jgi:acetyl esterase
MAEPQPGGIHPQAQQFLATVRAEDAPPLWEMGAEDARRWREQSPARAQVQELVGAGPPIDRVSDITIPGRGGDIGARVYEPGADCPATVVFYHGGGWVLGSVDESDPVCRALAAESGCRLVSVGYRLAPENRFPAAADDAYDAFAWAAGTMPAGQPIVVAGDSAGGNLAAATALRARDEGGPAPALQVLVYPVADHDFTTASYLRYDDAGLLLGRREMIWFWDQYMPDVARRSHSYASPLRAGGLDGLPPAYIVTAEYDPLLDEGRSYAAKLEAAGTPVTVRHFGDQIHGFFSMINLMDSAGQAVAEAGAAIRAAISAGPAVVG